MWFCHAIARVFHLLPVSFQFPPSFDPQCHLVAFLDDYVYSSINSEILCEHSNPGHH